MTTDTGLIQVSGLAKKPIDAAAEFHARFVPRIRSLMTRDVMLLFPQADHTHSAWRLAAVQELAREAAPRRVNALAGGSEPAIREAAAYLRMTPGVTGQVLVLDGAGMENGAQGAI